MYVAVSVGFYGGRWCICLHYVRNSLRNGPAEVEEKDVSFPGEFVSGLNIWNLIQIREFPVQLPLWFLGWCRRSNRA